MENTELKKALESLRKEKKRKFVQTVDLIVNLHQFDVRKEALNTFVNVVHPTEKKIAGFLTKKSKLIPTITEADFVKYNDLKDIKKLADSYDIFIAAAPLMTKIAAKFGRVFGPAGKMPSPQAGIIPKDEDAIVEAMLKKVKTVVKVKNKEMSIKLPIGKENMEDSKIIENVDAVLKQLETKLPRGKECIKNVMIKFTMTPSIKFIDNVKRKEQDGKED